MFKGKREKLVILVGIIMSGMLLADVALPAPEITGQDMDKIIIGRTTKAQVISIFGPPQKTETLGGEEVVYYQTIQKDPVTNSDLCNVLTVSLEKDGKVKNLLYKRYCQ